MKRQLLGAVEILIIIVATAWAQDNPGPSPQNYDFGGGTLTVAQDPQDQKMVLSFNGKELAREIDIVRKGFFDLSDTTVLVFSIFS